MAALTDNLIAYRLMKLLITPFEETKAFKLGIIDKEGNLLKKPSSFKTEDESEAYNYLIAFIFNIKKMLIHTGKQKSLHSMATALWLFKENADAIDSGLLKEEMYLLEDLFVTALNDSSLELDVSEVAMFLSEEMVTTEAIPKQTPTIKPKTLLRRLKRK